MAFALAIFAGSAELRAARGPVGSFSPVLTIAPKAKNPQQKKSHFGFTSFLRQSAAVFGRQVVAGFVEAAEQRQQLARKAVARSRSLAQWRGKTTVAARSRVILAPLACSAPASAPGCEMNTVTVAFGESLPCLETAASGGVASFSKKAPRNKIFCATHKFFPTIAFVENHSVAESTLVKISSPLDEKVSSLARRDVSGQLWMHLRQALPGLPALRTRVFATIGITDEAISVRPEPQERTLGMGRYLHQAMPAEAQQLASTSMIGPERAAAGAVSPQNVLNGTAFSVLQAAPAT